MSIQEGSAEIEACLHWTATQTWRLGHVCIGGYAYTRGLWVGKRVVLSIYKRVMGRQEGCAIHIQEGYAYTRGLEYAYTRGLCLVIPYLHSLFPERKERL
jgi:hypothetical protein